MQYLGFKSKESCREYAFSVREPSGEPLEYTLTIVNEAFASHRVRYQDAPEICSLRLRRELAANGNHPRMTQFSITDVELAEYRNPRKPKSPFILKLPRDD